MPVCDAAAALPTSDAPIFSTSTGLPAARASASAARKRVASPHASRQHAITRVSGSRAIHAITSATSMSASFPVAAQQPEPDAGVAGERQQVRAHRTALHRDADAARRRGAGLERDLERPVAPLADVHHPDAVRP